jgi:tight adherence protein B
VTLTVAVALAATAAWLVMRPPLRPGSAMPMARRCVSALRRRMLTRRRRTLERAALREALAEVVADVRAGQPPDRALARALAHQDVPIAPKTLATARWSGDIAGALRDDARASGQPLFLSASACWSVAAAQGAGLADALDRIVAQDRRSEEVRRQLEAHLAAPRATARMLALLPVFGLLLGIAIGGDPLGWLLGTPLGWACLVAGLLLIATGLAWATRIVARTERLL